MAGLKSFFLLYLCFVLIDYVVISYNKGMWYDLVSRVTPVGTGGNLGSPDWGRVWMGLVAWFILVLGLYVFVLGKLHSLTDCIVWGIFYAFIVYGVYNFTNMALFQDIYSWDVAWRDILSGAVSCSLALLAFYSLTVDKRAV
jgi:hypothetical protein